MASLTTPRAIASPTTPGALDPDITRLQRDEVVRWVALHSVTVRGDWTVAFSVPSNSSLSELIRSGAELYSRTMDGPLVSAKYLERIAMGPDFDVMLPKEESFALCTKPRGGANRPLHDLRRHFDRYGRTIASTPEVVAGFVAFHLAESVTDLNYKMYEQVQNLRGERAGYYRGGSEAHACGFAPSSVFRSSSRTLQFNSLVGLDIHDLPRTKFAPDLFVVEKI